VFDGARRSAGRGSFRVGLHYTGCLEEASTTTPR